MKILIGVYHIEREGADIYSDEDRYFNYKRIRVLPGKLAHIFLTNSDPKALEQLLRWICRRSTSK